MVVALASSLLASGATESGQELLNLHADVNAEQAQTSPERKGATPLDVAHMSSSADMVKLIQDCFDGYVVCWLGWPADGYGPQ